MTAVEAYEVKRGSVIVLRDLGFIFDEPDAMNDTIETLVGAIGHANFCLIVDTGEDGKVEVWGPDVDLRAKVEALIAEERMRG